MTHGRRACDCDAMGLPGRGQGRLPARVPHWAPVRAEWNQRSQPGGTEQGRPSEDLRRADHSCSNHSLVRQPVRGPWASGFSIWSNCYVGVGREIV